MDHSTKTFLTLLWPGSLTLVAHTQEIGDLTESILLMVEQVHLGPRPPEMANVIALKLDAADGTEGAARLKEYAREYGVALIVTAPCLKMEAEPRLTALDSLLPFERDTDAVALLRADFSPGEARPESAELLLVKHRVGPCSSIPLWCGWAKGEPIFRLATRKPS